MEPPSGLHAAKVVVRDLPSSSAAAAAAAAGRRRVPHSTLVAAVAPGGELRVRVVGSPAPHLEGRRQGPLQRHRHARGRGRLPPGLRLPGGPLRRVEEALPVARELHRLGGRTWRICANAALLAGGAQLAPLQDGQPRQALVARGALAGGARLFIVRGWGRRVLSGAQRRRGGGGAQLGKHRHGHELGRAPRGAITGLPQNRVYPS